ncbi:MAG: O-antigen ligase family protein, partial [Saprospiraceae bacterium]
SIVLAVSVFLICWHKGTSGALLALFLFLFCLLLYKYKTAFIKARFGIASALVILALVQQRGILISIQSISELISAKFSDGRFFSIMTSWWVFLENPLLGVGFNNWFIENYKYDLSYVNPLNLPHTFFRFSSHNYYMDILVELGIVGLISLLVPICYILYNYITNRSKYNALGKSFFASICLFLLLINYYSIILNNDYHFSAIQLLWLLGLAYISNNRNGTRYTMSFLKKILLGLSMLSFLWYVYSGYTDYKYAQYKDEWLKYLNMDSDKAMRILDEIYHPVFHSHHRYDGPILAKKADLYFQKGEYETSLKLYEEYIAINPYDGSSLLRLAIIYKDYKEDLTKAKYYALKIYEIQNTNCRLNMLLMDIAIDEKNKAVAERHLDSFIHGTQMPYGKSYRYYIDTYKEKILLLN